MPKLKLHPMFARLIGAICVVIVCILLVAGLAPFHAPKNHVTWLQGKNGVQFKRPASIVSAAAFPAKAAGENSGETLELLLRPSSLNSTNAILAFDGPSGAGTGFVVRQYKNALVVRQPYVDSYGRPQLAWPTAMDVFSASSPVLVTVVLDKHETLIYLNGVLKETFQIKGSAVENLSGRIVVGNSTEVSDSWPGEVLGLAMYRSQLTFNEVAAHYSNWVNEHKPVIVPNEEAFAIYRFNEGQGEIARNDLDANTNLLIPERYFLLHPRLFSSIKRDYKPTWQYWEDVALNIAGFIPFGLFAAIYFDGVRGLKHPAATTIFLGFLISFTIEGLQFFLPTRSSGCTDLITNTLGTVAGVMAYRGFAIRTYLDRILGEEDQQGSKHSSLTMSSIDSMHSSKTASLSA